MSPDIYAVLLKFAPQPMESAVAGIQDFCHQTFGRDPKEIVVVDNAMTDDTEIVLAKRVTLLSGDNTSWEFSGMEKGLKWMLEYYKPKESSIIVLANDTFNRGDTRHLKRFGGFRTKRAIAKGALAGWVDAYPAPISLFGRDLQRWVKSNLIVARMDTIRALLPLTLPYSDQQIFSGHTEPFFHREVALSQNYQQYLRTWLFGEEFPGSGFFQTWHSRQDLSEENLKFFQGKARSILCEHHLSAKAIAKGIPLFSVQNKSWIRESRGTRRDAEKLSSELARLDSLRRAGKLAEFDYPYVTQESGQKREWFKIIEPRITAGNSGYEALLKELASFHSPLKKVPVKQRAGDSPGSSPTWVNGWFPGLDAISLYGFLTRENPDYYIEIGSGNSTLFARQAIRDYRLKTRIVSIDPMPRAEVDAICDVRIRKPVEDLDLGFLTGLKGKWMILVDSSHRSFQYSDVTFFFTELLPRLPAGTLYGIHDIFLPYDYPQAWRLRYYNEQYLLACYLMGGAAGDEIILPNGYISKNPNMLSILDPIWKDPSLRGIEPWGGCFWMRRSKEGVQS